MDRKRSWALAVCTVFAITALAACSQMGAEYSQGGNGRISAADPQVLQSESAIGNEKAREIALAHAGFDADDVTIVYEGRTTEYDELMHEVEFYEGTREYDYLIDAATGDIVSFDEDAERYVIADWHRDTPPSTDSDTFIGDDTAKALALVDAGIDEGDTTGMRIELDYDNRLPRYEVEFIGPDKAYEYEINAITGAIINFETVR